MRTSVFVGVSLDGFLARANHDIDWLPAANDPSHGFDEFYASVDAVFIGRNTYEKVLTFGGWPYGKKMPIYVLTTRPLDDRRVHVLSGEPAEIVDALAARGVRHAYVDGGITIQRFLRAGLIDRMIITFVPVLIGEGIPLFGPTGRDIALRLIGTKQLTGGMVQSEYEVVR